MGFETSGPNEAMCVSGCGYSQPNLISGGRVWVWPIIQDSFLSSGNYFRSSNIKMHKIKYKLVTASSTTILEHNDTSNYI